MRGLLWTVISKCEQPSEVLTISGNNVLCPGCRDVLVKEEILVIDPLHLCWLSNLGLGKNVNINLPGGIYMHSSISFYETDVIDIPETIVKRGLVGNYGTTSMGVCKEAILC
jgi:hypothetical protein